MTDYTKIIDCGQNTGPHHVELNQWIDCSPFERLLNMTIHEAADGRALLSMPFCFEYAQGAGLMHGGAVVSLADTAVGMAIKSLLPPGTRFATTHMQNEFLRPVICGTITAEARVVEQEGRNLKGSATVYNPDGKEVMRFTSVFRKARQQGE